MLSQSISGPLGFHVNCPQYTMTTKCYLNENNPYMRTHAFVRNAIGLSLRSMGLRHAGFTNCAFDRPYVWNDLS